MEKTKYIPFYPTLMCYYGIVRDYRKNKTSLEVSFLVVESSNILKVSSLYCCFVLLKAQVELNDAINTMVVLNMYSYTTHQNKVHSIVEFFHIITATYKVALSH